MKLLGNNKFSKHLKIIQMKKINIIIVSIVLLNLVFSCTPDLINKAPLDAISPATFYQDGAQSKIALMGVYNSIVPRDVPTQFYQFDFMSDNDYCQDGWQGSKEFGDWVQNSSSWAAGALWSFGYSGIVRSNSFLTNVDKATMSETVRIQMKAEARFIRAYMYFTLISYYGDVPLVPEVQSATNSQIARTPKAQVLDYIIADLTFAAANLPTTYSGGDVGRVTKGAALAFKAKALLYNEKWADAAQAAQEVINLGTYSLYPNYATLFDESKENNIEVIFDIQYIKNTFTQSWPGSCTSFTQWSTANATADLINSYYTTNGLPITNTASGYNAQDPYTNRDPRLAASVVLPGSPFVNGVTFLPASTGNSYLGARPRKYADLYNTNPGNCAINTILMRYADVLLMRAEALIESGSTVPEVYTLIDQVRARVNMPTVESVEGTGLTQTKLRAILRHERRVEFFIEGTRYADMLRWKDASLVHDVYGYDLSKLTNPASAATWTFSQIKYAGRTFDPSKGFLWPIPHNEMQVNKLLTQNPGY